MSKLFTSVSLLCLLGGMVQASAWAGSDCREAFSDLSSSELSYSRSTIKGTHSSFSRMNTIRDLDSYVSYLGPDFRQHLNALRSTDVYLDSGGGEGRALDQYRREGGLGSQILISFETGKVSEEGLRVIKGRLVEEIPASEIGGVNLGSDVMGPYSYSRHPEQVIAQYSRILDSERSVFFIGTSAQADIQSQVLNSNGMSQSLASWLSAHFGLERVLDESTAHSGWSVYKLSPADQKQLNIPKLVEIWRDGSFPPVRLFTTSEKPIFEALEVMSEQKAKSRTVFDDFVRSKNNSEKAKQTSWWIDSLVSELEKAPDQSWLHVTSTSENFKRVLQKRILAGPIERATGWKAALGFKTQHKRTNLQATITKSMPSDNQKYDTISDFQGELFFSSRPDTTLAQYFSRLKKNGRILIYQPADSFFARDMEKVRLPEILTDSGDGQFRRKGFISWLREIPDIRVRYLEDNGSWISIEAATQGEPVLPQLRFMGLLKDVKSELDTPMFFQKR